MAIRTYKVTLDTKNTIAPEPVFLRQGDKTGAVVIDASVTDNGAPVSINGLSATFIANTADGKAVIADGNGFDMTNPSGGEFTYQVPNALSAVAGKVTTAYFSFSDSSGAESTFDVIFVVKKAVDLTQDKAQDYITIIDGTMRTLQQKIDAMNNDIQKVLNAYNQGNFYNKAETDSKDTETLSIAEKYADSGDSNTLHNVAIDLQKKADLSDFTVLNERVNSLTSLPNGSTSGDAELADIRVGQDGIVYSSAGDAVRNQLKRVNEHLKNLTKQSITTTPELISNHYIQASDGTLHEFPNNNYAVTDYIELPAGLMTISTTFTQRPDGAAGWAIYDVHKKFMRGGQTSEINNLDDSAYYIRIADYDIANLHENCEITFVFNNFSTLDEILMGKVTFSLEMKNDSFIDMTTGVVKTGVAEPKLSTSRKRLIPEHALQIITNCTPRPYGNEGFAIYDGDGKYIQGGKLGVITSVPAGARYIAFTHYANMVINPAVTFIYDRHYAAQSDLINLAERTAIFTPELVRGWVGYDGSAQVSPDDKYKCSIKFIPIPLNTKKITLNCNYNLAGKAGWQIVDAKGMFIRGGQTNNIIIQPNDFAIAFTNYDSSETHAGIKMVCTIGVDSDDSPFQGKSFGFLGDSITHGLDPDHSTHEHTTVLPHPWANQVADALGANMINYGVNSATVVPVDNHPTPLIEKYKEMSIDLDYVIVMGGINDAFNQIPLGKMEDRDSSTFYGGLHILYKALVQKYKRKDGKHVIVMTYPRYDALHTVRNDVTFDQFVQAMRDVAGYYSIPIIDLYNNCEISPFSDDEFEYWIENDPIKHDGLHNPHPRQSAADIIADTMCRYLKSSYME